ncbi:MAG TPA: hypothetical protein VMH27_05130 [Puia sp.]|nr:hypothetical protein [Puia sp.]
MLYSLCIYQIITCSIGLIIFIFALLTQRFANAGLLTYFLAAILLGITVYILYLNTEYIQKRKLTKRLQSANEWFNFIQLFHLSLFGVTFYFLVGPAILPEVSVSDHLMGDLLLNFGFTFNLSYRGGQSQIYAGINLVPALYLYLFHRAARKAEAVENFELDLFKTKTPPRQ